MKLLKYNFSHHDVKNKNTLTGGGKCDFEKKTDSYVQIYQNNIWEKTNQKKKYLYIYRIEDEIYHHESNTFPQMLILVNPGYLFVKPKSKIEKIPSPELNIYKTNLYDLNQFIEDKKIVIKFVPKVFCFNDDTTSSPKMTNEVNLIFDENDPLEIKKIEKIINENQKQLHSSLEWFNHIYNNCPVCPITSLPYRYDEHINNSSFKNKITINDFNIYYDIRSLNEYSIIEKIEKTFEDPNQDVEIVETYNLILSDLISCLDKSKIKYKKIEEDGKINSIILKYKDLNTINFNWRISDFI